MIPLLSANNLNAVLIAAALLLLAINVILTFRLQKFIKAQAKPAVAEDDAVVSQSGAQNSLADNGALVAAITAAVTAVLDGEAQQNGAARPKFIVRSIKKSER